MRLLIASLSLATALGATALAAGLPSNRDDAKARAALEMKQDAKKDIVETALAAGSFSTLAAALEAGELVGTLKGKGPFTVFAPTDEAFAALPEGTLKDLLKPENKATLQAILGFHVVPGRVLAEKVVTLPFAATVNGQRLGFTVTEGAVSVQGASVVRTDILCSNGVIHVIDAVLMPSTNDIVETAARAGSFETLAAALGAVDLVEALRADGPFTVFAPTDEAFAALPAGTVESLLEPQNAPRLTQLLLSHVVPGRVYSDAAAKGAELRTLGGKSISIAPVDGVLKIGEAKVVKGDIDASNGVIHVIDRVLLP